MSCLFLLCRLGISCFFFSFFVGSGNVKRVWWEREEADGAQHGVGAASTSPREYPTDQWMRIAFSTNSKKKRRRSSIKITFIFLHVFSKLEGRWKELMDETGPEKRRTTNQAHTHSHNDEISSSVRGLSVIFLRGIAAFPAADNWILWDGIWIFWITNRLLIDCVLFLVRKCTSKAVVFVFRTGIKVQEWRL